jgi:hypothetical protein
MTALKQLDLFRDSLPNKIQSVSNFPTKFGHDPSYCDNKVRYLESAIKHLYIRPNTFNSISWLIFDIDRATSLDELRHDIIAPEPTLFVQNPANNRAHVFYLIDTAIHKNSHSSQKALKFLKAVEDGLIDKLQSDVGFNGVLGKNPLHPHWIVQPTFARAYDLHSLSEYVDLNSPVIESTSLGKNVSIFESVSKWSYRAIRQGWPKFDQWYNAVLHRVEMVNAQFTGERLDYSEYKHIAKSIATWTFSRFSKQGFAEWQSNNGKKGGIAKGKSYEDKRLRALVLLDHGYKRYEVAEQLGVTPKTITNWKKGK